MRDPARPLALVIGQYLLLRRDAYEAVGGYAALELRATFAEDVALAELLKRQGWRIDIVDGRGLVSNEQCTTWQSTWRGWRKSAYSEVARKPIVSLAAGLLMLLYGLGPLFTLLRALRPGNTRRRWLSTVLAAIPLVAQIDARAYFDQAAGLSALLLLDTTRLVLTGRGTD